VAEGGNIVENRGTGGALIALTGNRRAVVDGCDGIVDYDEEKVIVRTGRLTVRFEGRSLRLKRLTENSAVIEGFIIRVEYQY
jgi:sporulation protein YqfC